MKNLVASCRELQVEMVKADIQNGVNAGKEVTVSKTEINFNGWTGCGYIIIDPNTGAGAYMISGGMNGAWAFLGIGGINCTQSWTQCYTNCISTLVPINSWTVFTNVTLYGNILFYLGGGVTSITIAGEVIVVMESPLVISSILLTASEIVYAAGGVYLAWVAGSSYGCMISCALNQCNY